MNLPKRRTRKAMGVRVSNVVRCPSHRKWVRGFQCCVDGKVPGHDCEGPIEFHHSVTRGAGGGDETGVPLCHYHHMLLESPGWSQRRIQEIARIDFAELSAQIWKGSPHRIRWERSHNAEVSP